MHQARGLIQKAACVKHNIASVSHCANVEPCCSFITSKLSQQQILSKISQTKESTKTTKKTRTIQSSIIRLNKGLLHLSILHQERIPLTPRPTKNSSRVIKGQIQGFCELELWVGDESDTALAGWIKDFTPCVHAGLACQFLRLENGRQMHTRRDR
jgi:hypothetical protein